MSSKRKVLTPRRQCGKNVASGRDGKNPLYIPRVVFQAGLKQMKYNQVDNEEDEIISCEKLVSYITGSSSTLTSVVLYLNSDCHRLFCVKPVLFKALSCCSNLKTFTLMLSQMKEDVLNKGLLDFGIRVPTLRKLCLINSVASDRTLSIIGNEFICLESLGFINCWYVNDRSLCDLFEGCPELKTLNVSYCKNVTGTSLMRMLLLCSKEKKRFKFYTKYSGVLYSELKDMLQLFGRHHVAFKDYLPVDDSLNTPKLLYSANEAYILEYMKEKRRCVTPNMLDLDAIPPDWEYDSDTDFKEEK